MVAAGVRGGECPVKGTANEPSISEEARRAPKRVTDRTGGQNKLP